jgi:CRP-like cAMP-binding protein/rhodanese-related sulfurtransferase
MTLRNQRSEDKIDHPVLKKLPLEIQKEILQAAEHRRVPAGRMLFEQGDAGDSFFMITSGQVRIFRKNTEGMETELAVLGPGDSFGEMALLTGAARSANVAALEDVDLTVLAKVHFDRILRNYPEVSLTLIMQMASWLIKNDQMLEMEISRQYQPAKLSILDFVLIIGISLLCALVFNGSNPNSVALFPRIALHADISYIDPEAAVQKHAAASAVFVDARPTEFFDQRHIDGAVNIPLSVFDIMYMMTLQADDKTRPVIVYGSTISRRYDVDVANKLYLRGHKQVRVLESGLGQWVKKGYPVAQ